MTHPTTAPAEPERDLSAAVTLLRDLRAAGWVLDSTTLMDSGTQHGLLHPAGPEITVYTRPGGGAVDVGLIGVRVDQAVAAVRGAGLAPTKPDPDPRRAFYNLVVAGVAAGLPLPSTINIPDDYEIASVWLGYDNADAVDQWAAYLGLPAAVSGSVLSSGGRSWSDYKAETWHDPAMPGWCVRAESYITVPAPADDAPAGGTR